ncbi:MAG: SDR family NAD(P)-dependent oxidoreductase [Kiritimatiellaeota bacterium]|nr:SDR family NAD(P)-dependent oxidoreductase [Kiritimatiellota bacterium]
MLKELTELSNMYGNDPEFVLAGGGNTSRKTDDALFVKPSGIPLATIASGDFIKLDRSKIDDVFSFTPPEDATSREEAVKRLMAATVAPGFSGRPSVETPLHHAMSFKFVVHLHPAKVNGMTCGREGGTVCAELFPDALWVSCCDPGYTLAVNVRNEIARFAAERGTEPSVIFLQNHGVFVGADSRREIIDIYSNMMSVLDEYYSAKGAPSTAIDAGGNFEEEFAFETAPLLRSLLAAEGENRRAIVSAPFFEAAEGALTPDHIVYAGSFALRLDSAANLADDIAKFAESRGYFPKVVAISGKAFFCAGETLKNAETTLALAKDAARVAKLAESFGGVNYLDDTRRSFIENWEVESYRKKARTGSANGELSGKIAVVTGGAQGFGLGISEGLLERGAIVAIADMNEEGAEKAAAELRAKFGDSRAFALTVDISNEESVEAMTRKLVLKCGGLDILVANAGVLRAGSVKTFERKHWDFVTNINYTGYFLCVKHLSKVMAAQNTVGGAWTDIVQINSKSGLVGSNRNAAYAGSKFGTIGMTQSFALELINDKIKVNSVCPGNFFDGPLWSDPDNGLFVQYLKSGKVPGAKRIEDVKRFYESKVPMGRGCLPSDVVKAIVYCVTQEYETGQAIPVAGGQVMLN